MRGQGLPSWQLELYRRGELSTDEASRVRQALADDASAREQLEELAADDARTLAAHPPRVVAATIRARLASAHGEASARSARGWLLRLAAPLGAAVAVVALSVLLVPAKPDREAPMKTRLKGLTPSLLVFRESAAGPEPLAPAAAARADDVVQLAYRAAGRRYGVVISIDGRGQVTRHLPAAGERAAELQPGAAVALPEAYRLDDAPGFERFFLVAADAPFEVAVVVHAAERLYGGGPDPARTGTRLELPDGFDQFHFEIRKEGSR